MSNKKYNILEDYLDYIQKTTNESIAAAGLGGWESYHYGKRPFKEKKLKMKKKKKTLELKIED